jgi:hypothetical protein
MITHYAYAAKTGIDNSNKYFELEEKLATGDIKIRIKRNIEDFICLFIQISNLY